jgi:glyoxalase family protein
MYWQSRLQEFEIPTQIHTYFGQTHLTFEDPHGLLIELVEQAIQVPTTVIPNTIPHQYRIQGFYGARLLSTNYQSTHRTLVELMGYTVSGEDEKIRRYQSYGERGAVIDLVLDNVPQGTMGVGTVHHIAFRTVSSLEQLEWQAKVKRYGLMATAVRDRNYFTSIYFREPGGILYEIATDGPGFMVDEPFELLGESLKLPAQYEAYRTYIESKLIPLEDEENK